MIWCRRLAFFSSSFIGAPSFRSIEQNAIVARGRPDPTFNALASENDVLSTSKSGNSSFVLLSRMHVGRHELVAGFKADVHAIENVLIDGFNTARDFDDFSF